jgi:hypothetical protein
MWNGTRSTNTEKSSMRRDAAGNPPQNPTQQDSPLLGGYRMGGNSWSFRRCTGNSTSLVAAVPVG